MLQNDKKRFSTKTKTKSKHEATKESQSQVTQDLSSIHEAMKECSGTFSTTPNKKQNEGETSPNPSTSKEPEMSSSQVSSSPNANLMVEEGEILPDTAEDGEASSTDTASSEDTRMSTDSKDGNNEVIKWTAERTTFIIREIARKGELLYNVSHEHHSNKLRRFQVQEDICQSFKDKFNVEITCKALMEKWSALRGQFRNELRKVNDSHKSGCSADDIYIPRVYWFDAMTFLTPYTDIAVTLSTPHTKINVSQSYIHESSPTMPEHELPQPGRRYFLDFLENSSAALQVITDKIACPGPRSEYVTFGNYITSELEAMTSVCRASAQRAKFKIIRTLLDAAEELET